MIQPMLDVLQSSDCSLCDPFINENWLSGLTQGFNEAAGSSEIVALMIVFPVAISLFSWSRSSYIPAIVVALMSGTALQALPGLVSSIGSTLLWAVGGIMLYLAFRRA